MKNFEDIEGLPEKSERMNRVFADYTLSIEGEAEPYGFFTTASTTTEVLLKLGGSVSGKKILDIKRTQKSDTPDSNGNAANNSEPWDEYDGCKVCNKFNTFLWACTGASEVAILACDKHNMYSVIQSSRYKGDDINWELLCRTWNELTETMTDQDQDRRDEQWAAVGGDLDEIGGF